MLKGLVFLACLLVGCKSDISASDHGRFSDPLAFNKAYAEAVCALQFRCCHPSERPQMGATVEECQSKERSVMDDLAARVENHSMPLFHYEGESWGERCLTDLARLECHEVSELTFTSCPRIYAGRAVEGDSCLADNWCRRGLGCAFETDKDHGTCRPLGREGQACGLCEPPLKCQASSRTCEYVRPPYEDWCGFGETCQRGICIAKYCRLSPVCTGMPRDAAAETRPPDAGVAADDLPGSWDAAPY